MNIFNIKFSKIRIVEGTLQEICSQFNPFDIIKVQFIGPNACLQDRNYWHEIRVPIHLSPREYPKCILDSYHQGNIGNSVIDTDCKEWRLLEPI